MTDLYAGEHVASWMCEDNNPDQLVEVVIFRHGLTLSMPKDDLIKLSDELSRVAQVLKLRDRKN